MKTITPKILRSTHIAQKCPVCNGFGSLKWGSITCHGCRGKGYVLLPVDRKNENKKKLHHHT